MTNQAHTPGPWAYNEQNPSRVTGPRGETVAAVYGGMVGESEQLANARLIATAPEMQEYIARKAEEGDGEAQSIIDPPGQSA